MKLTELAVNLAKTNHERHSKVEEFMLINDSATIAVEVPVYIYPNEVNLTSFKLDRPLTGHIDLLQIRWNKIHILDYKPEAEDKKKAVEQLLLYAMALSKRCKIDIKNFICAYFDEKNYFEFNPLKTLI